MRPLILLDVDGVLNVLDESRSEWAELCSGHAVAEGRTFRITWSPVVVERFVSWIASGVEVRWLTTWGHDANTSLRHLLGLPHLEVAGTYDQQSPGAPEAAGASHASVAPAAPDPLTGRWWKYDVVNRLLIDEPHRLLVWIDDELHFTTAFRRWALAHEQVHPVGPDGAAGLTAAELDEIEQVLAR